MVRHFLTLKDDIKVCDYVNKSIPICDTDDKALKFQIPRLYMPFGISGFAYQNRPVTWNVEFVLKGWDKEDGYVRKFYDAIKHVEDTVIKKVCADKQIIFGTTSVTDDDVRNMFNSNLKEAANGYDAKLRVKVDVNPDITPKFKVFDVQNTDVTQVVVNGLYARQSSVCIVELSSVYFMNRKFGLVWRMAQMQIHESQFAGGDTRKVTGLCIKMPTGPPPM
jgi:hypothetical protein